MQASDIGFLMLAAIAVVGSLISLLDHRSQFGPAALGNASAATPQPTQPHSSPSEPE